MFSAYPRFPEMPPSPQGLGASLGFLGTVPVTTTRPYRGPRDTLEKMAQHALGPNGEQSFEVRRFTEWVIGQVWPKCYISELISVRNVFVQRSPKMPWLPLVRFTGDPTHVERVRSPARMVKDMAEHGSVLCDCDESACLAATMCLCIGREVELVAMGFAPKSLSHVAVRVREPKSRQMILLDGVAGPREREAAGRAVELMIKSLY
jgi:hypothetical protein